MKNTVYVKNMVCNRCIRAVEDIFKKNDIPIISIQLGEVEIDQGLDEGKRALLKDDLEALGFAIINDRKGQLIEQIKNLVIEAVHYNKSAEKVKWPEYLSDQLHLDYKYLSSLFSSVESITLEQYIINQKIEKVKELLVYDELSLKEIAFQLDYSSTAYLSNQFKKVMGMTPTHFKNSVAHNRKSLDHI
ncbi:helix-turn-helix domain-containing protein [Flagellimonas beolgyonensis]|uniref:helix-turn-helix domain-containing protein n=1 Tax=Flagellimonas beolgyonensis TaxID=864064 RepID=UPI000F8C6C53|nr:AraC family transcriptional regulator [Allomuricauda beolgyonensis]